jgi:hypothetical protein
MIISVLFRVTIRCELQTDRKEALSVRLCHAAVHIPLVIAHPTRDSSSNPYR